MMNSINTWLIRLFCIFWAMILFLDYANNSGYLTQAFTYFQYSGLLITSVIISGVLAYIFTKSKGKGLTLEVNHFRNIYSYLFVLMFMAFIMLFYINQTSLTASKASAVGMFLFKTMGFHIAVAFIFIAAFSTGSFIVTRCGLINKGGARFFIDLATGLVAMTTGLFLLGVVGMLNQMAVFIFILLMLIPGRNNIIPFIKKHLLAKLPSFQIHMASIIPYGIIIFLMALNFCYTTRTFPIGFDDLNLYMNTPKLIAGYAALTQGGDAYNWSIMMSLGFIMYKSAAIAILISVVPGALAMLVLYNIARRLSVSREWSLLACSLFYTLPNIIWQSRNDAKVDLALTFIILCAVLMLLEYYISKGKNFSPIKLKGVQVSSVFTVWALCGLLVGYAFGIKYTSMLCVFGFLVYLFYITAGKWAAAGMFFFNFVIIFGLKLTRFGAFEAESGLLAVTPFILSLIFFGLAIKDNRGLLQALKLAFIFGLFISIAFIPWAIKNVSENKAMSFESILTGKSPLPELYPEMRGGLGLLDERGNTNNFSFAGLNIFKIVQTSVKLIADASGSNTASKNESTERPKESKYTDKYEEIRRYLGYESGIIRFISLPYDLAMKTNVRLWSADTGILFLIIIPVFMLVYNSRHLAYNILKMILLLFILSACMLSVEMFGGPFNISAALEKLNTGSFADADSFKFLTPLYIFIKKLFLITGNALLPVYTLLTVQSLGLSFMLVTLSSILIYFLFKNRLSLYDLNSKSVVVFTFCVLISWMILSSGIFWYGMVGFAALTVVAAILINQQEKSPANSGQFMSYYVSVCLGLWFILILPFQFMPIRFTMAKDMTQIDFSGFIDRPFASYAIGASTEKEVLRQFFQPAEQGIINHLNNDKKAGILNVSTFLTYHIVNNDLRVHADNQLGIFDRVYTLSEGDRNKVIQELKRIGIKYVLVSLHTPTLDMTPEKSLTRKFNNMMNTLVNNQGAKLLFTNRIVERPDGTMDMMVDGQSVKAMYHVAGMRVINQGTVVMFEIL